MSNRKTDTTRVKGVGVNNVAKSALSNTVTLPIPMKVRYAPTKLMKDLKYGKGYEVYNKESHLPEH